MKRSMLIAFGLAGLCILFVFSCRDGGTGPALVLDGSPLDPPPNVPDTPEEAPHDSLSQTYLQNLWTRSNHDEWDIISGTIDPGAGGVISGEPETWPAGYEFSLDIPPGAIQNIAPDSSGGGDPQELTVTISIHVPRDLPSQPPGEELPAVYKLMPDSLEFLLPVTVTLCFPPWLESNPTYDKFCFFPDPEHPGFFGYSDLETVAPQGLDPRKNIQFETSHFSRWGLENGKGGGGPTSGGSPPPRGGGRDRRSTYPVSPTSW